MNPIYISLFIIFIILSLQAYFTFIVKDTFETTTSEPETTTTTEIKPSENKQELAEIVDDIDNELVFDEKNPWSKIKTSNLLSEYYIKIYNFDENKYAIWRNKLKNELNIKLDYDIIDKELIITTHDEATALSIINLIISDMNGDISLSEIDENNLISSSIKKCKKYDFVKYKLIELIKENNIESFTTEPEINIQTSTNKDVIIEEKILANSICSQPRNNNIMAYNGSEFASPFGSL